jgi:hypothetical protein
LFIIPRSSFLLSDLKSRHIFTNLPGILTDTTTIMDVTTVSGASAFAQQTVANNVSSSVAAKVHDEQKTQGAAVLQLLQDSTIQQSAVSSKGLDVRA